MAKKGAKKAAAATPKVTKTMKAKGAKKRPAAAAPKAMKAMNAAATASVTAPLVRKNAILDVEWESMCLSPSRPPPAGREALSPAYSWASTLSPAFSYSSCFEHLNDID